MQLDTQYESPRLRVGVSGPLVVALYRFTPDLDDMKALDRVEEALLETHEKLTMLTVVRHTGAINMPAEVRQYSVAMSEKYAPRLRGTAIVVVAKGLAAAMARAALSALTLVMRAELALKNCATLSDAVEWARALPGQDERVARELDVASLEQYVA